MSATKYYRGGAGLAPRRLDVRFGPTGLVLPVRGVSVSTRPDGLDRFGGAFLVGPLPADLIFEQVGKDPTHFEIIPVRDMPFDEYAD